MAGKGWSAVRYSARAGEGSDSGGKLTERAPDGTAHAPQIGQAIEEVNSNNQELLRKYRRELQLRKKCHNELVRLKGECLQL